MYECFHCGHRTVVWENDFMASELGYEIEGIVHILHCANCGAEIEYYIPEEREEEENEPCD